jgi:hypothetical protein
MVLLLLDSVRAGPGFSALEDYSADNESEQAMGKPGFPSHHGLDQNPNRGLSSLLDIVPVDQQSRRIEGFTQLEQGFMSEAAIPRAGEAKVIALGHFNSKVLLTGVSSRPLDQQRLRAVFRDYSYTLVQRPDIDVVPDSLGFVDGAPHSVPFQSGECLAVMNEYVPDAAVAFTLDEDLAFSDKVSLEGIARGGSQNLSAFLH